MRTSYRDILLLACCRGLLVNGSGPIAVNASGVCLACPGFVSGLIERFGARQVIVSGALPDDPVAHLRAVPVLLGVGCNLMYTGATRLLTAAYPPGEKAAKPGLNDLMVLAVMGVSSFSSGVRVDVAGWTRTYAIALPLIPTATWLAVLCQNCAAQRGGATA